MLILLILFLKNIYSLFIPLRAFNIYFIAPSFTSLRLFMNRKVFFISPISDSFKSLLSPDYNIMGLSGGGLLVAVAPRYMYYDAFTLSLWAAIDKNVLIS